VPPNSPVKTNFSSAQLEALVAELLPTSYFNVVFTHPDTLDLIALASPRVVYDRLLPSAAETVLEVAADPKCQPDVRLGFIKSLHEHLPTLP
jgi:hypothetical protein